MHQHKIQHLVDLDRMLLALLGDYKLVDTWWKSQNYAFDMLTPEEMFDKDPLRVVGYIEGHALK